MRLITLTAVAFVAALNASASTLYTQSAPFFAALGQTPVQSDYFANTSNGQPISAGSTLNGLTYGPFTLTGGASQLDITSLYSSVSGQSLGANHTALDGPGATYFYGGEGTQVTFAHPVLAAGVFLNVNPNSGLFTVVTSQGTVVNDASFLESGGFSSSLIFAGLISTNPFSSLTIYSTGPGAVYNVAGIVSTQMPEPATFLLAAAALAALAFSGQRVLRR